jgi:putative phage-type endonuclease
MDATQRAEWLEARRVGIGGSDAATLFDANPYQSRLGLYYDKIGQGEPDDGKSEAAMWGTLLEPAVRAAYEMRTGRRVREGLVMARHPEPDVPLIANTDGTIDPVPEYSGFGVYEGKVSFQPGRTTATAGGLVIASWAEGEGPPLYHQIQGQAYLAVSGLQWVGFACFMPDDVRFHRDPMRRVDMQRNDRFIEVLCEEARRFWREHVLPRVPPPADGSEATFKALRYAFPKDNGRVFIMPPDVAETAAKYRAAKNRESEAEKEAKALGNVLRQAMGSAAYALGEADGAKLALSYKEQRKAATVGQVLDIVEGMMGAKFRTHVEVALDSAREPNRVFKFAAVKTVENVLESQPEDDRPTAGEGT